MLSPRNFDVVTSPFSVVLSFAAPLTGGLHEAAAMPQEAATSCVYNRSMFEGNFDEPIAEEREKSICIITTPVDESSEKPDTRIATCAPLPVARPLLMHMIPGTYRLTATVQPLSMALYAEQREAFAAGSGDAELYHSVVVRVIRSSVATAVPGELNKAALRVALAGGTESEDAMWRVPLSIPPTLSWTRRWTRDGRVERVSSTTPWVGSTSYPSVRVERSDVMLSVERPFDGSRLPVYGDTDEAIEVVLGLHLPDCGSEVLTWESCVHVVRMGDAAATATPVIEVCGGGDKLGPAPLVRLPSAKLRTGDWALTAKLVSPSGTVTSSLPVLFSTAAGGVPPGVRILAPEHGSTVEVNTASAVHGSALGNIVLLRAVLTGTATLHPNVTHVCLLVEHVGGEATVGGRYRSCGDRVSTEWLTRVVGVAAPATYRMRVWLSPSSDGLRVVGASSDDVAFSTAVANGSREVRRIAVAGPLRTLPSQQKSVALQNCAVERPLEHKFLIAFNVYRRSRSVLRLWDSLLGSTYPPGAQIDIKIVVDHYTGSRDSLESALETIHNSTWPYGTVSLWRQHVSLGSSNGHLLYLEDEEARWIVRFDDDNVVSPRWFEWITAALRAGYDPGCAVPSSGGGILAVSLFSPVWNQVDWQPFSPPRPVVGGVDAYLMQLPSTWGVMFSRRTWRIHTSAIVARRTLHTGQAFLPAELDNAAGPGWFGLPGAPLSDLWVCDGQMLRLMVEQGWYTVFPSVAADGDGTRALSFSTTWDDGEPEIQGDHSVDDSSETAVDRMLRVDLVAHGAADDGAFGALRGLEELTALDAHHRPRDNPFASCDSVVGGASGRTAQPRFRSNETPRCFDSGRQGWCHLHGSSVVLSQGSEPVSFRLWDARIASDTLRWVWRNGMVQVHARSEARRRVGFDGGLGRLAVKMHCCTEDLPFATLSVLEADYASAAVGRCSRRVRVPAFVFGASNFPQFGHALLDMLLPLIATVSLYHGTELPDMGDRNVLLISTNPSPFEGPWVECLSAISRWPVVTLEQLASEGVSSLLPESVVEVVPAGDGRDEICFDHVTVGLSDALSMWRGTGNEETGDSRRRVELFRRALSVIYRGLGLVSPLGSVETYWNGGSDALPLLTLANRRESRSIVNSAVLLDTAQKVGLRTTEVYFEDSSLQDTAKTLKKTSILVTPSGSSTFNVIFLRPGSTLLVIVPYGASSPAEGGRKGAWDDGAGVTRWMGFETANLARAVGIRVVEVVTSYENFHPVGVVYKREASGELLQLSTDEMRTYVPPSALRLAWQRDAVQFFTAFVSPQVLQVSIDGFTRALDSVIPGDMSARLRRDNQPRSLLTPLTPLQSSLIRSYGPRVQSLVARMSRSSLQEVYKAQPHYRDTRVPTNSAEKCAALLGRSTFKLTSQAGVNSAVACNICFDPRAERLVFYRGDANQSIFEDEEDERRLKEDLAGFTWAWKPFEQVEGRPPQRDSVVWLEGTSVLLSPAFAKHITHFSEVAMFLVHASLHPTVYPWFAHPDRLVHLKVTRDDLRWSHDYLRTVASVLDTPREPPLIYFDDVQLAASRRPRGLVCFDRAAIVGQQQHSVGFAADPWEANILREAAYAKFQVQAARDLSPRHRLRTLVVDRTGRKQMVNVGDVMHMLRETGLANLDFLPRRPWGADITQPVMFEDANEWDFAAQVAAMRMTDVLIAVHGGALANVQFMEPGSVVIAIMPTNYIEYEWSNLAAGFGVTMLILPTTDFNKAAGSCPKHDESCETERRPFANRVERCRTMWHCQTVVDVGALEVLYRQADYLVRTLPAGKRRHLRSSSDDLIDLGFGSDPEGNVKHPLVG